MARAKRTLNPLPDRLGDGAASKFGLPGEAPKDVQWLTDRIRELELEAENRDESLALIAHELRTPLTVLQGGIWLLLNRGEGQDGAAREDVLQMLHDQAAFLSLALMNMLTLARVRPGELPDLEPVVLREEVRSAMEAFQAMAQNREVRTSIPKGLPPVLAHPSYVQEILVNLLVNADRYSPESASVVVTAQNRNKHVHVSVTDEGQGLPDDELSVIFDRFFQSSRRTGSGSGTGTGTGLGLTVCKRLVEAQGGTIWAENARDYGLRVTFTLTPCPPS